MAATHAFKLTVVNCPSQVRVFIRGARGRAEGDQRAAAGEREREKEKERGGCLCRSTMARLLFRFLFLSFAHPLKTSTSTLPKKQKQKQDLAKTNLAFVSADDPATAYPFLEVNGW